MRPLRTLALVLMVAAATAGCGPDRGGSAAVDVVSLAQAPQALLAGEAMAIAYSGYREGQHPDREGLHPHLDKVAV